MKRILLLSLALFSVALLVRETAFAQAIAGALKSLNASGDYKKILNSWGNQAAAVSVAEVRNIRQRLGLETVHLTVNSGDQN